MEKTHQYSLKIEWTGNIGAGTKDYRSYERSHLILLDNKIPIAGSSDPAFRGDHTRHSPEELFVASIAACHMLWYLHLCSDAGIVVTAYLDQATANMMETANGNGKFTTVTLHPAVTITNESMMAEAKDLHHKANEYCFIANSCNFPILHEPFITIENN